MTEPIHILGAGLAGSIMHSVLGGATVIEKGPERQDSHRAVLHFRDPRLGQVLDLKFKKVIVTKSIYHNGTHYGESNAMLNNMYSLKTLGLLQDRSIGDLREKERWISDGTTPYSHKIKEADGHKFHSRITKITEDFIWAEELREQWEQQLQRGTIISTLPLPVLMKLVGMSIEGLDFEATPIEVFRFKLPKDLSNVCQTIYFPDFSHPVYRATIDFDEVIIEALPPDDFLVYSDLEEFEYKCAVLQIVMSAFGLPAELLPLPSKIEKHIQPMGKITPLPDDIRRGILYELTTQHRIYSIGRFALWKNIRADDILQDAFKIKEMLTQSTAARNYTALKEGGGSNEV